MQLRYLHGYTAHGRSGVDREQLAFPPDAHGFLYYHPPTALPPLDEGHLRFRITPSSDPATFLQGKDLLYPDGEPWNLRCGRIANSREYYLPFRRMLLEDGLVTEAQLNEWGSCYNSIGIRRRNVMSDLEKPFAFNFEIKTQPFWVSSTSGEDGDLPLRERRHAQDVETPEALPALGEGAQTLAAIGGGAQKEHRHSYTKGR
ncbi:hypothetical protein OF83DRAFT_1170671 [Amylostereum chailletii]|nr:hypothetical protein OF83DRAFT_1170671 [Amylostereum chailletii]